MATVDEMRTRLAALRERRDRLAALEAEAAHRIDVFAVLGYEPTDRQRVLHDAGEFEVGYGGAAGGGKTRALTMEGIRACVQNPGIQVRAFRRTFPQVRDSYLRELAGVGYAQALGAEWRESDKELRFPNGSVFKFSYAENVRDATNYQSAQYQLLLLDEATLMDPSVIDYLTMRVRSGNAHVPVLGIRYGTNPGGPGHSWFKTRFVDATAHGAQVVTDEATGRQRRFIPSKAADNPHLNAEYHDDLARLPEAMRAAFRDGDWDVFAGQVFTEWRHDRHVVAPVELPASWRRVAGIDYGYAAPWAVLWAAFDEDGRAWVYNELYDTVVGEADQARRILAAEGDRPANLRAADPAMWARRGDAASIAEAYRRGGVAITPATNDRLSGWQRLHSYLGDGPACAHHRALGWETCPKLHVFTGCENLIRTLPALPYSTTRTEDVDTTAEDHAADALRYLLMSAETPTGAAVAKPTGPTPAQTATDGVYGARPNLRRLAF
jgi:hypothetical protein